jgi:hypothetical protein
MFLQALGTAPGSGRLEFPLGAQDSGGVAEHELSYQAGWDQGDSHVEDFLFHHRRDQSGRLPAELVSRYEILHYPGFVPSASTVCRGCSGEMFGIGQFPEISRDHLYSGSPELAPEMPLAQRNGSRFVAGGGKNRLDD